MAAEDIRTFLARIFLGKAKVRSLRPEERKVELQSLTRELLVRPLRKPERVLGSTLLGAGMSAKSKGFRLPHDAFGSVTGSIRSAPVTLKRQLRVRGQRILRFEKASTRRVKGFSVKSRRGVAKVAALPLEIGNRLQWYAGRADLSGAGEAPLALYYPVLEDGLIKSVLNRDKGTLIVWYNPQKAWRAKGLLMVRSFSSNGGLEWRWIDA